jgi:hypothetical protein
MGLGSRYELEHLEGIGVLCAGGCDAEVVAIWEFDSGGLEAEDSVDLDAEAFV